MLALAASAALVGSTGCFGSYGATTALWKFNDGATGNKWLNWLIFLGLNIVPVYPLFLLGDLLIFNTIEFFTGSNPIGSASRDFGNGNHVAFERDKHNPNIVRLEHRQNGTLVGVYYVKKDGDNFSLLDQQRVLISDVRDVNGTVTLRDKNGNVLVQLDPKAMKALASRSQSSGSVIASLERTLATEKGAVARINVGHTVF